MDIYYLGPDGSFSSLAAKAIFAGQETVRFCAKDSFRSVAKSCASMEGSFAVVPVENSGSSSVHESVDILFSSSLYIVAEHILPIRLHVYVKSSQAAKMPDKVYSHPKAFEQLRAFFVQHSHIEQCVCGSTSQAAEFVRANQQESIGFLGSDAYQGDKDFQEIQVAGITSTKNFTRFLVLSQQMLQKDLQQPKVSLLLRLRHKPKSLLTLLQALGDADANLTRIESRPIPGTQLEYHFWVDYEIAKEKLEQSLLDIRKHTLEYRLCGLYEKQDWPI